MKCPYCPVTFVWHPEVANVIGSHVAGLWYGGSQTCPGCGNLVVRVHRQPADSTVEIYERVVWPRNATGRSPCPEIVPPDICGDYSEAVLVLADSPKASAALSRRCLQHILRTAAGVKHGDLATEIDQVIEAGVPSYLAEAFDAVRVVGNFAAHPMKSQASGAILPVETNEAEWNLDTVELALDYYFVQPAKAAANKAALNTKLAEAGKDPLP